MKSISLLLLIFIILPKPCKTQSIQTSQAKIITNGQMPSLAKDHSNNLHLVFGSSDSIMYAVSTDAGISFSKPVMVDRLTKLYAFSMRGPQISVTGNKIVIIACNQQGNIYTYQKEGSGKWKKTVQLNDVDAVAREGFLGLNGDGKNYLYAIWLDSRIKKQNNLFGARSIDGGKTWSKNNLIYSSPNEHICECCKPSVIVNGDNIYIMFRNWLKGNRDLYLVQSTDAGKSFGKAGKLGNKSWALNGCPMDGGGIALDNKGNPETVWRRESKIFTCKPGEAEKEIGTGKSCTMATSNGKSVYAWVENGNVVCLLPDHTMKILGKGKLPVISSMSNNQLICIWENEKEILRSIVTI